LHQKGTDHSPFLGKQAASFIRRVGRKKSFRQKGKHQKTGLVASFGRRRQSNRPRLEKKGRVNTGKEGATGGETSSGEPNGGERRKVGKGRISDQWRQELNLVGGWRKGKGSCTETVEGGKKAGLPKSGGKPASRVHEGESTRKGEVGGKGSAKGTERRFLWQGENESKTKKGNWGQKRHQVSLWGQTARKTGEQGKKALSKGYGPRENMNRSKLGVGGRRGGIPRGNERVPSRAKGKRAKIRGGRGSKGRT